MYLQQRGEMMITVVGKRQHLRGLMSVQLCGINLRHYSKFFKYKALSKWLFVWVNDMLASILLMNVWNMRTQSKLSASIKSTVGSL